MKVVKEVIVEKIVEVQVPGETVVVEVEREVVEERVVVQDGGTGTVDRGDLYGRILRSLEIPDQWTNLKTPLMDIKIPEYWRLIDNYDKYQEIISRNATPRLIGPSFNPPKSDCLYLFHNFEKYVGTNDENNYKGITVKECLQDLRVRLYEGDKDYVLDLFEHWAREDDIKQPKDKEPGHKDYDYFRALTFISGIYAQEKPNIEFSDTFEAWLTDRLLNTQFRSFGHNDVRPRCQLLNHMTWVNDCSTTRFMYTEAQLVGGLALGNKEIFDEGIDSLQYITTIFDDENIYTLWAARGIRAMSYHDQIPTWLTNFAVILETVGYDFMEHEMPNGSKVHEAIKFSFDHVWEDDVSIFWPYIQLNIGTNGDRTFAELLKPMHERLGKATYHSKPQKVVRQALRYVDEYQPELKERFGYEEVYSKRLIGTEDFSDVWDDPDWYYMYHLDSAFDMHSIYKANAD